MEWNKRAFHGRPPAIRCLRTRFSGYQYYTPEGSELNPHLKWGLLTSISDYKVTPRKCRSIYWLCVEKSIIVPLFVLAHNLTTVFFYPWVLLYELPDKWAWDTDCSALRAPAILKTPQIRSFFWGKWLLFGVLRAIKSCFAPISKLWTANRR